MSLFPAYAVAAEEIKNATKSTISECESNQDWLSLSSFKIGAIATERTEEPPQQIPSPGPSYKAKKSKHSKKNKRKHEEIESEVKEIEQPTEEPYKIDKKRNLEFLTVQRIARPAAPKYDIVAYIRGKNERRKKQKWKRYFKLTKAEKDNAETKEETITKKDLTIKITDIAKERNENYQGFAEEETLSKKTAEFNQKVNCSPNDVQVWLDYVDFQDVVFQFEKSYKKGSMAKGQRVTADRKVSILEKALFHNASADVLHRKRLVVLVEVYPSDELQAELKRLVQKDEGNIILWQGYIEATQCSMSHCNTPAVLDLYIKCLHKLHTLRRSAKLGQVQLEENILRMMYQCGLFLKQAGLFEQLWTLLQLYLQLNLTGNDSDKTFKQAGLECPEKQLLELEEIVLNSKLPIHELWLRVEKLRESCHFLPVSVTCEDPQRLVFSEDVADLIHPITLPGNTFKLTVAILTLLKLPLLPHRHTTMRDLKLDFVPWALDGVETLLPIFSPLYPVNLFSKHLLDLTQKLAVGPQYLKTLPGQEEYLIFLLDVISGCRSFLNGEEKLAITVWWFRFNALLAILEKEGICKLSSNLKKKLKNDVKNLLKNDRNNILLYKEYASIEFNSGNLENARNVLKTAIASQSETIKQTDDRQKADLCATYRSLIELEIGVNPNEISEETKAKCVKQLVSMVTDKDSINIALEDFQKMTDDLLETDITEILVVQQFLPIYFTEFVICHAWLIYFTTGIMNCVNFIQKVLTNISSEDGQCQIEILSEFLVAIIFRHCTNTNWCNLGHMFDDILTKSLNSFPNNLFLLSVLAKKRKLNLTSGQIWWKYKSLLFQSGHALASLFVLLIEYEEMVNVMENWIDTSTGQNVVMDYSWKNRMLHLFKQLTKSEMCTRRCGLIWRLYLQFLHAYSDPKACRNAYYSAVEECPWLKALYIDAAIYIPEELAPIQDLIIEKQLRIHVTPEELDVLRD